MEPLQIASGIGQLQVLARDNDNRTPVPAARPLVTGGPPLALHITTESAAVVDVGVDMIFTAPKAPYELVRTIPLVLFSVSDCASALAAAELTVIPPLLLTSEIEAGSIQMLAVIRIAPLVTWIPPRSPRHSPGCERHTSVDDDDSPSSISPLSSSIVIFFVTRDWLWACLFFGVRGTQLSSSESSAEPGTSSFTKQGAKWHSVPWRVTMDASGHIFVSPVQNGITQNSARALRTVPSRQRVAARRPGQAANVQYARSRTMDTVRC